MAVVVQQDAGGLDVAVHDAALVYVSQHLREPAAEGGHLAETQWTAQEQFTQRLPADELHDQERPVRLDAEVVHGHQTGMVQPGQQARLLMEPVLIRSTGVGLEHLDCDRSAQLRVEGSVDVGHPIAAKMGLQPVPAAGQHRSMKAAGVVGVLHASSRCCRYWPLVTARQTSP